MEGTILAQRLYTDTITMKSKYVTLSIFYPNANGWDKASTDSPMNHANYVFILKSD